MKLGIFTKKILLGGLIFTIVLTVVIGILSYRGFSNKLESESTFQGISLEEDKLLTPGPPGDVQFSKEKERNVIKWLGTRLDIVSGYVVYRTCQGDAWSLIGRVPVSGDNSELYVFTDKNGNDCKYAVSTMDIYGNESQKELARENSNGN